MTAPTPTLGARIRQRREALRLTQEQLATRAGITRQSLSRIECGGHEVYWDTACKLADALGVTLDALRDVKSTLQSS
jgi:transcriptional regulator with XRE-family HTH domain